MKEGTCIMVLQEEGWDYDWSFTSALLFTVTIMTTVGYGHISPQTDIAKVGCLLEQTPTFRGLMFLRS